MKVTMAEELLKMNDVSIRFTDREKPLSQRTTFFRTLPGINLAVHAGEILLVAGASGAGKSLLVHSIVDILPSNALRTGRISYRGQEIDSAYARRLRGRKIAIIPQSLKCLDPLLTVERHIITAQGKPKAKQEIDYFLHRLGLPLKVKKMYPSQLSGGMARRVLCIISLVTAARVIVADEPTPGLDRPRIAALFKIFREYSNRGNGVLLVTHDFELAEGIADRIAVFREGRIIEVRCGEEIRTAGADGFSHEFSRKLWRARSNQNFADAFNGIPSNSRAKPEVLPQGEEA